MKKVKGVDAAMEFTPLRYAAVYEDPRRSLKYQSLMQDYKELYKETEANKEKLQMVRKKKMTLLAEVRFLRQRYKYLKQAQTQNLPAEIDYVQPQKVVARSKNVRKEKNFSRNGSALRYPVPRSDLNLNGKIQIERDGAPSFNMNKKQKAHNGKEAARRHPLTIPDLNQKERIYNGKEGAAQNVAPVFDLNQISREEEEFQDNNSKSMRLEERKISSMRGGIDEQQSDIKLSACRNVGNGSSQARKRKISWQDQMALRV